MSTGFRGTVTTTALIIDSALIGELAARQRVFDFGDVVESIRLLVGGRWLVLLSASTDLRAELAPGLVLTGSPSGISMAGLTLRPGYLTWWDAGQIRQDLLAELPPVHVGTWFDLGPEPPVRLHALDRRELHPEIPTQDVVLDPNLRAAARIGRPSRRRHARLTRSTPSRTREYAVTAAVVATLMTLFVAALALAARVPGISQADPGIGFFIVLIIVRLARSSRRRPARKSADGRPLTRRVNRLRTLMTRLMGKPAAGLLERRHERYLRSLAERFQRREWDDALRDAIGIAGDGHPSWLTLRMPKRREKLTPTLTTGVGPRTAMGESALSYLRALYRDAARQLESAGKLDAAVFVHADLLRDTETAVGLLEHQGRHRQAAELAEARKLPAEAVVRLWWRAGEHDRAVSIARARGAFASAIKRLGDNDQHAALQLRTEWVRACQQAGDHPGAVRAAWPVPQLRQMVLPDIEAGVAGGGPTSGAMFAHLVTEYPSNKAIERAEALLASRDRELLRAKTSFIDTFATLRASDPIIDRRLATAAVRSSLSLTPTRQRRTQTNDLARRGDPLLRADLPTLPARDERWAVLDIQATERPGELPVHDAVTLPGRSILVAFGEQGTRMLTLDGRTRAQWDVPVHQLVLSDASSVALLVHRSGDLAQIYRLDLLTRRVTPWTVLRARTIVNSFDGSIISLVDDEGIALIDVLSARPRVLWRELDRDCQVLRINRTPNHLTALVSSPALGHDGPTQQLWSWELPTMTLRVRRPVELDEYVTDVVVHEDAATMLTDTPGDDPKLTYLRAYAKPIITTAAPGTRMLADGKAQLVARTVAARTLATIDLGTRQAVAHATFPDSESKIRLREHRDVITIFDESGRIIAIEPTGTGDLTSIATKL